MDFKLTSQYKPTGDQPEAIAELVRGVNDGLPAQVLLGVTGSGKTFTMANVIQNVNRQVPRSHVARRRWLMPGQSLDNLGVRPCVTDAPCVLS